MELQTLKKWRVIVPGTMIVLFSLPIGQPGQTPDAFLRNLATSDSILRSAAAIICGAVYYLLNLRSYFLGNTLNRINTNIKTRLLEPCLSDPLVADAAERLRQGRTLINLFYQFVDQDPSLTERSKNVRHNGLIWTSIADFMAVSHLFILIYWLLALLLESKAHFISLAAILVVAQLPAQLWAMPQVTDKHIALSNEQLDYIHSIYPHELCARLRAQASQLA